MSKEKLTQDMMAAAKKHLPEMMCEELREQLEELGTLRKENASLTSKLATADEALSTSRTHQIDVRALKSDQLTLAHDQKKLKDNTATFERDKEVFELRTLLNAQTAMTEHAHMVSQGLVRNTEYRKATFGSDDHTKEGYCDVGGQYINPQTESSSHNKTVTESAE